MGRTVAVDGAAPNGNGPSVDACMAIYHISMSPLISKNIWYIPTNMPDCASIETESKRCYRHRFDSVLMLAYAGMLTGYIVVRRFVISERNAFYLEPPTMI